MITKRCYKCTTIKTISEFNKDRTRKDGFANKCRQCERAYEQTEKRKLSYERYVKSDAGKLRDKKYDQTEKGKQNRKRVHAKYYSTAAGKTKQRASSARRKSLKLKATPKWLTQDQIDLIEMKYALAVYLTEVTGIKWHVDHIIPLKGKNIVGLHVPWNLRVIPAEENIRKGNRL